MIEQGQQQINPKIERVLTSGQRARYKACGRPLPRMLTADGQVRDGAHAQCRYKWCPHCGRKYQQRVYACIQDKISQIDERKPRMITLTMRLPTGLHLLKRNIDIVAAVQRRAHQRLRDHDHATERAAAWAARGDQARAAQWRSKRAELLPLPTASSDGWAWAKTWSSTGGFQSAALGKTTYIWAREITTGANDDRWHVHLHYLVPSYADGERLISAWDAEAGQRDATQCMISECISAEYARSSPARYMTKYVTSGDVLELPDELVRQYLRATKGRRQYDAGGEWRPLGIGGDVTPPHKRVVAVERLRWYVDHKTGEIRSEARWYDATSFFGGDEAWREWAHGRSGVVHLNQYRTMLSERERAAQSSDAASSSPLRGPDLAFDDACWYQFDST